MNYETYQSLRAYCRHDLAQYIDTPGGAALLRLNYKLHGDVSKLKYEVDQAMGLYYCDDVTPRERAAAHLLAVISNHRAITWHREPETPNGRPPAELLSPSEADELIEQTREAIAKYADAITEREAAAVLAIGRKLEGPTAEQSSKNATPAPVVEAPDPERRLVALRALGGTVTHRNGRWKFTGMAALVKSEKGRKRSDEKTIRHDLREAAQAEREATQAGAFSSGLGQRGR